MLHQFTIKMKSQTLINVAAKAFIGLSALSLLSVSVMAFYNPQDVMNLVDVKLSNTDAYSSIRGVYGGAGLSITLLLVYLFKNNVRLALGFLATLWGLYALSRIITVMAEGALGAFGSQWLFIESTLFIIAMILLLLSRKFATNETATY